MVDFLLDLVFGPIELISDWVTFIKYTNYSLTFEELLLHILGI